MKPNPYQNPSSLCIDTTDLNETGIPHEQYLQFRRSVWFLMVTMATFFILFGMQMLRQQAFVDAAIACSFGVALLMSIWGIRKCRTASEAKLTLTKFRAISSSMRHLCLWLGPLMMAIGVFQIAYVPVVFRFNPWGFLFCGLAAIGSSFHWPHLTDGSSIGHVQRIS